MLSRAVRAAYRELIYKQRREVPFWILAAFVPTFAAARATVYLDPDLFLNVGGTHIHHFTYGIFLLAIVGYVALVYPERARQRLAVVYGIGLALAADEFGMWLRLTDDYSVRGSYDAVMLIVAFLISVVYFVDFWYRVLEIFGRLNRIRRRERREEREHRDEVQP